MPTKSADYIAGLNEALREAGSVAKFNGDTARACTSKADQDQFAERARGAAEVEQYIRQLIEVYGGEPKPLDE